MPKYKYTNPRGSCGHVQYAILMDSDNITHIEEDVKVIELSDDITHKIEDVEYIEVSEDTTHNVEVIELSNNTMPNVEV